MVEERKVRLSARQWIEIGLRDLSENGPNALTIDALCRNNGKTKGSFYAHFVSQDAFLGSLARCWYERNTEVLLQDANSEPLPQDQLNRLNYLAVRLDAKLDQGIRALAERHPALAEAVSDVDAIRIANLSRLHRAICDCSDTEAMDLATIEYAAYVGLQIMQPRRSVGELERLYKAFEKFVSIRLKTRTAR